jgi:hypothetical protein
MRTILLLIASNTFMTFAWYGHLKYRSAPLAATILASWLIALGEYCLQVPANRIGYGQFSGYQLKIIQEVITLAVFVVFAYCNFGRADEVEPRRRVCLSRGGGGLCVLVLAER